LLKIDFGLIFTVINLLVLYLLMKRFLFKPVHKILEERQAKVDEALASAAQAEEQAKALERERSEAMQDIETERQEVLQKARRSAAAERERILADANERSEKLVEEASAEANRQREQMLQQAQSEITELVLSAAAKVALGGEGGDDGQLYDIFLEKAGSKDE
jgi:F-type H+-transporting ATPase subunit b